MVAMTMSTGAWADRLIQIPTGLRVSSREVRTDAVWPQGKSEPARAAAAWGLGQAFEVGLEYQRWKGTRSELNHLGVDFSYQYVVPVPDLVPGIAFGVRDLFNVTHDRIGLYAAATWRFVPPLSLFNEDSAEFTLGLGLGRNEGLFLGAALPVGPPLRLLAEYDARRITAGVEVRPWRGLGVRWLFFEGGNEIGLSYRIRF